jgi:opacity protein-like surface antigen
MGSRVAANGKSVFCLLVAVVACVASARGQAAPAEPQSADCRPEDSCEAEPPFTFHNWMCGRPLCGLFSRWSATTREVPWANWSACPISVGAFAGVMNGGPLIGDWVGTTTGFDGGWRIGWDVTPSWGTEMRFAFASLSLYDSYRADQALIALDNANGLAANDPQRQRYDSRNAEVFQWDVDILYYPWRETRLRPYILAGIGLTDVNFTDRIGQSDRATCLSLPLGIGLKYLCDDNLALRLDLLDDIAMSNQHLQTQNNLSLTVGLELRFGGSRKVYWPFDLER